MKHLFFLTTAFCVACPAHADEAPDYLTGSAADTLITVTATGSALRVDQAGQPVSVIGEKEISSIQGPDVTRVLERLPGVTLTRTGGLGANTSLFVRGANSQQLLVLVDGIRVADVAAPGGGFDFGNLTTGAIGRVELLRGSNSVIWGSEAIGGVISLTSREINGAEASIEYGAYDTVNGQVLAGITGEKYGVTLNAGYVRSDGFSQASTGTEADGFEQYRAGGRAHVELTPNLTASVVGRYSEHTVQIDGFPAPSYVFADTPEYQKTREIGGRAALAWKSDNLDLSTAYQISDIRRRYYDPSYTTDATSQTQGQSRRAELKGTLRATHALRLDFGSDHEWSRIDVSSSDRRKASLTSANALLGIYTEAFTIAGGVRYDDHSRFGHKWTFGANASVVLTGQWRARASYGEGFKVPTLYQLFSEYGNTSLAPERSRSYDLGVEYGNRNADLFFALTGFQRNSRNLIDFAYCPDNNTLCDDGRFGYYSNVGRARAQGFEVEIGARMSQTLRGQAAYTYVKSTDRTVGGFNFGTDLARRPRHALTVSTDWTPVKTGPLTGLSLGADVRLVGNSYNSAGNYGHLKGYAIGTLRASIPVDERLEVFGRIENITNERYTTVTDYSTAGRSAFVGLRAKI